MMCELTDSQKRCMDNFRANVEAVPNALKAKDAKIADLKQQLLIAKDMLAAKDRELERVWEKHDLLEQVSGNYCEACGWAADFGDGCLICRESNAPQQPEQEDVCRWRYELGGFAYSGCGHDHDEVGDFCEFCGKPIAADENGGAE